MRFSLFRGCFVKEMCVCYDKMGILNPMYLLEVS